MSVTESLGMLQRRDEILQDQEEMLLSQNDPNRLVSKQRGATHPRPLPPTRSFLHFLVLLVSFPMDHRSGHSP